MASVPPMGWCLAGVPVWQLERSRQEQSRSRGWSTSPQPEPQRMNTQCGAGQMVGVATFASEFASESDRAQARGQRWAWASRPRGSWARNLSRFQAVHAGVSGQRLPFRLLAADTQEEILEGSCGGLHLRTRPAPSRLPAPGAHSLAAGRCDFCPGRCACQPPPVMAEPRGLLLLCVLAFCLANASFTRGQKVSVSQLQGLMVSRPCQAAGGSGRDGDRWGMGRTTGACLTCGSPGSQAHMSAYPD